jgi:hypothetical protein
MSGGYEGLLPDLLEMDGIGDGHVVQALRHAADPSGWSSR